MSDNGMIGEGRRRDFIKATGVGATSLFAGCIGGDGEEGDQVELGLVVRTESEFPTNYYIHELVVEEWEELGIEFNVNTMASTPFHDQILTEHDYEHIFISGWGGATDRLDPQFHIYNTFHSSNAEAGTNNITRYQNSEYDDHAETVLNTIDFEDRQEATYRCLEILAEEQPITPVTTRPLVDIINEETIENFITTIEGATSLWQYKAVETDDDVYATAGRGAYSHINPLDQPYHLNNVLMSQIFGQPFRFGPEGDLRPGLCTEYEVIDDQTVQLHLRDDIMFHDGEEITAEDFQYSYHRLTEDDVTTPVNEYLDDLDGVEIDDERTVTVTYESSTGTAATLGIATPYIMPEHVMEEWEEPQVEFDPDADDVVGSGPFEIVDFRPDEEFILERFDDYWDPAQVERVVRPIGETEPFERLIREGDLDALYGESISIGNIQSLGEEDHLDTYEHPNTGFDYIGYNTQNEPTSDTAFRRALGMATPKNLINEVVHENFADVIHSPIPSANDDWHNPDVEEFGGDLDAARNELEEAGYRWDDNDNLLYPE